MKTGDSEEEETREGEEGILILKLSVVSQPKTHLKRERTSPGSHDQWSDVLSHEDWTIALEMDGASAHRAAATMK